MVESLIVFAVVASAGVMLLWSLFKSLKHARNCGGSCGHCRGCDEKWEGGDPP